MKMNETLKSKDCQAAVGNAEVFVARESMNLLMCFRITVSYSSIECGTGVLREL